MLIFNGVELGKFCRFDSKRMFVTVRLALTSMNCMVSSFIC